MKTKRFLESLFPYCFFLLPLFFTACSTGEGGTDSDITLEFLTGNWYVVSESFEDCKNDRYNRIQSYEEICTEERCYKVEFTADRLTIIYLDGFWRQKEMNVSWELGPQGKIEFCDVVDFMTFSVSCRQAAKVERNDDDNISLTFEAGSTDFLLENNTDEGCIQTLELVRQ